MHRLFHRRKSGVLGQMIGGDREDIFLSTKKQIYPQTLLVENCHFFGIQEFFMYLT